MGLFDLFTKSISNIINDEINSVTSKLEKKIDNAITGLFSSALKKLGIGGKLNRELQSRFAQALFSARQDKYFNKASSASDRLSKKDICANIMPKMNDTNFNPASRLARTINKDNNTYQFPDQDLVYYMKMSFRQYTRTTPQARPDTKIKHTIVFPLPKELTEGFAIKLNEVEAGLAGAVGNILQEGGKLADKTEKLLFQYAAGKLNEATAGQSGQFMGAIPNPYLTVMFQGISLRSFSFSWTFSPRNEGESLALKEIIRLLKASALPQYGSGDDTGRNFGFLQYPLMVMLDLYPWAKGQSPDSYTDKLIGFKPALIENVTINYAPNGIPSFFAGTNLPTFYQITIDFKELEYFTSNDFGRSDDKDKISDYQKKTIEAARKIPGFTEVESGINSLGSALDASRRG